MKSHKEVKVHNLEIELDGDYNMDNNIFGLVYSGIQISGNCFF